MTDNEKIRDAFENKDLQEIRVSDSWKIFKIMSEFVQGFEKLAKIGPCVSIFGSARTQPNNIYYKKAEEIAYLLTQKNFGVITGGRSEEHTSELQSHSFISYAVFCLKKKTK